VRPRGDRLAIAFPAPRRPAATPPRGPSPKISAPRAAFLRKVVISPPGQRGGHKFVTRNLGDLGTPGPSPLGVERAADKETEAPVHRRLARTASGSESCVHTSAVGARVLEGWMSVDPSVAPADPSGPTPW